MGIGIAIVSVGRAPTGADSLRSFSQALSRSTSPAHSARVAAGGVWSGAAAASAFRSAKAATARSVKRKSSFVRALGSRAPARTAWATAQLLTPRRSATSAVVSRFPVI